jgi:CubicO group peptidase (beta-lactamase class C family)
MNRVVMVAVMTVLVCPLRTVGSTKDHPQREPSEVQTFERKMTDIMTLHHLPGAGAVVVTRSGVAWAQGFGVENREKGSRAQPDSVFDLMSVSKIVTASALLALVEDGGIDIDDEINPHLPFPVVNPSFADRPITFRMLLDHTSSIHDDREIIESLYGPGDPSQGLETMLRAYLMPTGQLFQPTNFLDAAPGEQYQYSNVGFALLGLLVERIAEKPFPVFCREKLFEPTGMKSAGWFLSDIDRDRLVVRYSADPDHPGELVANTPFGWPGYPDGQLRSNLLDLARFLQMLLRSGEISGRRVLKSETVDLMFTPQGLDKDQINAQTLLPKEDIALPWQLVTLGGKIVAFHSGRGSGLASGVIVDREAGYAAALWISGSLQSREAFVDLLEALERVGLEVQGGP